MPELILYECDRKACKNCSWPMCYLTSKIEHAIDPSEPIHVRIGEDNYEESN